MKETWILVSGFSTIFIAAILLMKKGNGKCKGFYLVVISIRHVN